MKGFIIVLLSLVTTVLHAQKDTSRYYISKVQQSINFDGLVGEEEWSAIQPFPLRMHLPSTGDPPTESSEIRIAYDDDYIYLSGRLYDSQPELIMANTKRRDATTASTEFFGIILDTYNDNKNALAFFTTPTGIRWDAAIFNDANGSSPMNMSWNAFWDVRSHRDETGWSTEMRIPFSSLAFEARDEVLMGLITWRYIARKNEIDMFPFIPPDFGEFSAFRPSMAQDVIFRGIKSSKPFYVTPYVLTGYSDINQLNDAEDTYLNDRGAVTEIGGDIKYGISKNWTIDLSINTDFAQVEADDQQVNLTRFNLFFPEKRLFFQERSGIFSYNFGRTDQLFYSRRIGINEDDEIQRILGGARIVGRSGRWDIGFLSMQTADDGEFKGENLSVFRARRDVFNENSDVGLIVTNEMDFEGNYNTTYGLDLTARVWREQFLSVRWAQTLSNENDYAFFSMDPTRAWISLSSRNQRGFSQGTSLSRAGRSFNPSLGFEQRENYTRLGNRLQYLWFNAGESKIFNHGFDSGGAIHWNNDSRRLESLNWRLGWNLAFKNSARIELRVRPNVENLLEDFELSDDVIIPVGDYDFISYSIEAGSAQSSRVFVNSTFETGSFYDGTRTSVTIEPTASLSSSLELSGSYQFNRARFNVRDQTFLVHLVRLKALVMFNTKFSIAAVFQYNSLDKNFLGNVRLRYNPAEGNDLFIVWNDDLNTDRFRESPYPPRSNQRSILLKYSYTFRL